MSGPTRTVERCLRIAAPRTEVYRALLDPGALSRWMYATVQWKGEKGASYRIDWQDTNLPAHAQGEILEIEENRRLVLSWFMEQDGCETVASFDLDDEDVQGTLLKFRHTGFPGGPEWQSRFDLVAIEWDKVLENLRFHIEEGSPGQHAFYLRHSVNLPATRERVQVHWIAPAAVTSWLAREAFIDPAVGGEIDLLLREGGRVRGTIRAVAPGKHVRLLWDEEGRRSLLGISFWSAAEGSVLTLTQRSYKIAEDERDRIRAVWDERFGRLRACLARRPGCWPAGGSRRIELERTVDAPRDQVWKAWADPAALASWFCDRAEFTPRPRSSYTFLGVGHGEQRGEVLRVETGARLSLSWDIPAAKGTTELDLQLLPADTDPSKTRIALVHSGWGEGEAWGPEWRATRCSWRSVLSMLEFYLRDGQRGSRRSFLLRRRLPIPVAGLWRRLSTSDGLSSWLGSEGAVDLREEGSMRVRLRDGSVMEGRITMAEPEEGIAFLLSSPDSVYLEFGWTGTPEGSCLLVGGLAYGAPESWPLQQRILWGERIGRLEEVQG